MPYDPSKARAHRLVWLAVRAGALPRPSALPCTDCGSVWTAGRARHHYDHSLGYALEHALDVQPVCVSCHVKRGFARGEYRPRTGQGVTTTACRVCGSATGPFRLRRCGRCRTYWLNHGVERPVVFTPAKLGRPLSAESCSNCGKVSTRYANGRCPACNTYHHKTGRERPSRLFHA
jgi:hypothetical protein